jgi:hypothetical protein
LLHSHMAGKQRTKGQKKRSGHIGALYLHHEGYPALEDQL